MAKAEAAKSIFSGIREGAKKLTESEFVKDTIAPGMKEAFAEAGGKSGIAKRVIGGAALGGAATGSIGALRGNDFWESSKKGVLGGGAMGLTRQGMAMSETGSGLDLTTAMNEQVGITPDMMMKRDIMKEAKQTQRTNKRNNRKNNVPGEENIVEQMKNAFNDSKSKEQKVPGEESFMQKSKNAFKESYQKEKQAAANSLIDPASSLAKEMSQGKSKKIQLQNKERRLQAQIAEKSRQKARNTSDNQLGWNGQTKRRGKTAGMSKPVETLMGVAPEQVKSSHVASRGKGKGQQMSLF